MKLILKIVCAPVVAILAILVKLCSILTYCSGLLMGAVSVLFAIVGVGVILTGSPAQGIAGLVVAFLLSPYGIPMLAIRSLGAIQSLRYRLQDAVYG